MTTLSPNVPTANLINGAWIGAASGKTFPVLDPATDDVLARICADTRVETARRKARASIEQLQDEIEAADDAPRGFGRALFVARPRAFNRIHAAATQVPPTW